jgi:hypothetical protein
MKNITISLLLVLLVSCAIYGGHRLPDIRDQAQLLQDLDAVDVVVVAELLEAQVAGNFPIAEEGADVKKEVAIEKRVYTRGEIELRGIVRRFLKGRCLSNLLYSTSNLISFNIPTSHLVSDRDDTVLEVPASNIPNLKIGGKYVIMIDPINASDLYFTAIWPVGSPEAVFVEEQLKREEESKQPSEATP